MIASSTASSSQPYNKEYRLLEANDSTEALEMVRAERPDLVIADILMPTMDGYEFVRQVRADPAIAQTRVMFYTAHFLEHEAWALAQSCGVSHVLLKPSEPQVILDMVATALSDLPVTKVEEPLAAEEFTREHLQLLTNKLSNKADELRNINQKLNALLDISLQLASEHDPELLVEKFSQAARDVIGAKYAIVGLLSKDVSRLENLFFSGMKAEVTAAIKSITPKSGILGTLLNVRQTLRMLDLEQSEIDWGLEMPDMKVSSFIGATIASPGRIYGWLCLWNKIGLPGFTEADEQLASVLAAQLGRIYENNNLYDELQRYSLALEQEIAEHKQADAILRDSQAQMAGIIDSAMDAIISIDVNQRIILFNHAAEMIFGYPAETVIGQSIDLLLPEQFRHVHRQHVEEFGRTKVTKQAMNRLKGLYGRRHNGEIFPIEASISHLESQGRKIYTIILRDITLRRQAEEALQKSEAQFRHIAEMGMLGIMFWNIEGRLTDANDEFHRIIGYTREDLGAEGIRWDDITPPEYRKLDELAFEEALKRGKSTPFEKEYIRKDGSRIPVMVGGGLFADVPDTGIAFALDLSERKSLEAQLRHSQKMEAMGRLAGGVAHDFNNLLTAIMGYSHLLLRKVGADNPMHGELEEIHKAGVRAAALTRQLLAFSHRQVMQPKVLNLNTAVTETEKMLRRLIGEDIELRVVLKDDLWNVKADPGQITQVIMNLAVNARDALPVGGKLVIETDNVIIDDSFENPQLALAPGQYVRLTVSNTGIGMNAETRARIFEPFFTTKGPEKGTGLGLATVFGIVKQSDGHISVYSELGHGTAFKIYFPQVVETVESIERPKAAAPQPSASQTILVVEDDNTLRLLLTQILTANGYNVLVAENGKEALTLCAEYNEPIHLLLSDLIMPEMNGNDLANRLRATRPEMQVIFMSGYIESTLVKEALINEHSRFIQKPFSMQDLVQLLHDSFN